MNNINEAPDYVCGMCAHWYGGKCHNEESAHNMAKRKGGTEACEMYAEEFHGTGWYIKDWIMHHKALIGVVLAVLVFVAVMFFTGDIFAAYIIMEILMEIFHGF